MNTFKKFIEETYTLTELKDIANGACWGGVTGMIFYHETTDLYDQNENEIEDLLVDDTIFVEGSIINYKNECVWRAATYIAQDLLNLEEVM